MTQEDKGLLLKDLCARLPYGTKVAYNGKTEILSTLHIFDMAHIKEEYVDIKPYLRPTYTMTDEEFSEMKQAYLNCSQDMTYAIFGGIDWLNKHHFDYRGLIEKGLALEAPEDMYIL